MRSRSHALKNGPRSSAILTAAVLMAVALPVSVVFPREVDLPSAAPRSGLAATPRSELGVPAAAIQPATLPATAISLTPETADWTDAASQSASMVLIGSLLIGIGSIVKRTV
jgi:hypothetical protein